MKLVVRIESVGIIAQLDDLALNDMYAPDEIVLVTDTQDVQPVYDYFGNVGKKAGVQEFGGFFVIPKDGDFWKVWGFFGTVPFNYKQLWEIKWRHVDEKEWNWLKNHASGWDYGKCPLCGCGPIDHTRVRATAKGDVLKKWKLACMREVR